MFEIGHRGGRGTTLRAALLAGVVAFGLAGCGDDDNAAEEAEDAAEEAGEAAEEAIEEAGDAAEEATD